MFDKASMISAIAGLVLGGILLAYLQYEYLRNRRSAEEVPQVTKPKFDRPPDRDRPPPIELSSPTNSLTTTSSAPEQPIVAESKPVKDRPASAAKPPHRKIEEDVRNALYAVGLAGVIVTVRENKLRLNGDLQTDNNRYTALVAVRSVTDLDVEDRMVFRPGYASPYRTIKGTSVFSDADEHSQRIVYIPPDVKVWVTEFQGRWLRIESRRGNKPGYVSRENVIPYVEEK